MKAFCFLFIFLLSLSCTRVALKNNIHEDLLKSTIANNIKIPFIDADTLIYMPERSGSFCGNTPKRWNKKYYPPHFDSSPYKEILLTKYPGTILFVNHDEYFFYSETNESVLHKKVFMEITGYRYTNKKVQVTEVYYYAEKSYYIQKLFTFENNQWSWLITASDSTTN